MTDIDRAVRRYLDYVMGDLELSATALAKMAGVATSTLTRFLNDQSYKFKLSSTTIEKIANATKINPAPFFENSDVVDLTQQLHGVTEGQVNEKSLHSIAIADVELGVWRENIPPRWDGMIHEASSERYRGREAFITRFRGDPIEGVVADGEFLFCVKTADFSAHGTPLDRIVIVQTTRDNDLVELTLGSARWREGALWLKPLQKGMSAEEVRLNEDGRSSALKILGYVLYAFHYPRYWWADYPNV